MESFKFHNDDSILKYCQKSLNICYLSSLAPPFDILEQTKAWNATSLHIKKSLKSKIDHSIDSANPSLKNEKTLNGEPKVYYSLIRYKMMGSYDILTDISEHVALFQLMGSLGNVNHSNSVLGYWIFDSN